MMNSDDWKKIKEVFNEAAELPKDLRSQFLAKQPDEIRIEVEKMLNASDTDESLLNSPIVAFNEVWQEEDLTGQKVGDFKILRTIGEGGMGSVYEAIRDDGEFEQRVAIKLIKSGLGSKEISRRFRQERQILATLEHPHIARLVGGGLTEKGLPYYAMEFIEGQPIDEFCRENNLSVNERLELFRQVCSAVSFAHSRLVVHRDLKPGNIFVSKTGIVKLLDFGISKVLTPDEDEIGTATQLGIMTPAYASPEQIRGETVSTSTDVYSLGIILYELLTDALPYQTKGKSIAELLEIVSNERIEKPSLRLNNKTIKGDLDTITLKALQRSAERRYASVEQLSEDIRRFLNGLPVSAQADSFSYRYRKFIQRNKLPLAAAVAIFLALVGGILATLYQNRLARQQQAIAEKRFDQVRKLANNVVFKYHDAIAKLPGSTETREMLVKDATEYLDNLAEDAGDNPELQGELAKAYMKIGNVQGETYLANLGDSDGAIESYEKSERIFENLLKRSPENLDYQKGLQLVVDQKNLVLMRVGRWNEAEVSSEKNVSMIEALINSEPENLESRIKLIRGYQVLGDAVNFQKGHLASIDLYRKALAVADGLNKADPNNEMLRRNLIVSMQRIGTKSEYQAEILKEKSEPREAFMPLYVEAEELHRRSYQLSIDLRRDFPKDEIYVRYISAVGINWGTALARIGKGGEGIPLISKSCEDFRKTVETDTKNTEAKRDISECLQYLAFAYDASNLPQKAIEANKESLKILEEITVTDPTNFEFLSQAHLTFLNTGDIYFRQNKLDEALNFYRKSMEYVEKMATLNHNSQYELLRSDSKRKIGEVFFALSRNDKNEENIEKAKSFLDEALSSLRSLQAQNQLGKNNEHKIELIEAKLNRLNS